MIYRNVACYCFTVALLFSGVGLAQEKKLYRLRVGGGSASAAQMAIWFAKEDRVL